MQIMGCHNVEQNWIRSKDGLETICPKCGYRRVIWNRWGTSTRELLEFVNKHLVPREK